MKWYHPFATHFLLCEYQDYATKLQWVHEIKILAIGTCIILDMTLLTVKLDWSEVVTPTLLSCTLV